MGDLKSDDKTHTTFSTPFSRLISQFLDMDGFYSNKYKIGEVLFV